MFVQKYDWRNAVKCFGSNQRTRLQCALIYYRNYEGWLIIFRISAYYYILYFNRKLFILISLRLDKTKKDKSLLGNYFGVSVKESIIFKANIRI